ncbi:Six-hairpin glycosidase-like protein [Gossypium australe]|uniref:Six-hairpin glycosidase-like protein n=1 Tax=Gossypium australe TaxID=47621 RepID=A0A5B6WME0_9ROSI|nr:Six-hairpin glycosidase-like protein [Gossypium australe]
MAWRSAGSLSRSVISAARAPSLRSPPPLPRLRPSVSSAPRLQSRRLSYAPSRNLGELGCVQSFLPLHSMVPTACLTSHLTVNVRACCELSHVNEKEMGLRFIGRNGKDG